MAATQITIRLNPKLSKLLAWNARAAGVTKSEYMRDLLEKDGEYLTGEELDRRVDAWMQERQAAKRQNEKPRK